MTQKEYLEHEGEKTMTTKEYLSRAISLRTKIRSKIQQITELESLVTTLSATLNPIKVQTSKDEHKTENIVIKIAEYREELNNEVLIFFKVRDEIKESVDAVCNVDYKVLLELRYLVGMSWEDIAAEMNYSISYIFKLHSKALKEVIIPENRIVKAIE